MARTVQKERRKGGIKSRLGATGGMARTVQKGRRKGGYESML